MDLSFSIFFVSTFAPEFVKIRTIATAPQCMNKPPTTKGTVQEKNLQKNARVKDAIILMGDDHTIYGGGKNCYSLAFMKVGGLHLIERSVLALQEAGIEYFHLVVNHAEDDELDKIKSLPRLQQANIEYIGVEDLEKGKNPGFGRSFLLTQHHHIFSLQTIQNFVDLAIKEPNLPALACDLDLNKLFKTEDAVKVSNLDGFVRESGIETTEDDLLSTGLFYFPEKDGIQVAALLKKRFSLSTAGLSQTVIGSIEERLNQTPVSISPPSDPLQKGRSTSLRVIILGQPKWIHVIRPGLKREANRLLKYAIRRQEDGWVSRKINRPISTRLTFLLAKYDFHPNTITTLALLLTLVGAWFAGSGIYKQIVLGALIFQIASILDGCDGELARLTFRATRFGSWYEQVASSTRYIIFFGALGISAWISTDSKVYLFAVIILAAMAIYMLSQMIMFAWKHRDKEPQLIIPDSARGTEPSSLFGSVYNIWRELNKQDMLAFVTFLLCIIFLYQAMFWFALLATTATAIMVSRSVTAAAMQEEGAEANILGKVDPIFFYLLGVVILCALIFNMDLGVVTASLAQVGNKIFLIFSVAVLWIIANTLCIYMVIGPGKVSFADLLYNQLTGDAYNTVIPMAGLGGEPYKIKHLTQWLDWHTASRSIVVDRLIHSNTGILFGAVGGGLMLAYVDNIPAAYYIPLVVVCSVLTVVSIVMAWLTLTKAPSKLAGYVLKKLKIIEDYRSDPIPPGRFFLAYFFKFLGRTFYLVEIYVMFRIFGLEPSFIDLASVAGMIALSATMFFVIPQGLGVNESGISLALDFLGYAAALGITFGLLRRARMIFWALFGIALHMGAILAKKFEWSKVRS